MANPTPSFCDRLRQIFAANTPFSTKMKNLLRFLLAEVWYLMNNSPWYLGLQCMISLILVFIYAHHTVKEKLVFDLVFILSACGCIFYMGIVFLIYLTRVELMAAIGPMIQGNEVLLRISLLILTGLAVMGLVRFICFFSDSIGSFEKINDYTIAAYLMSYLHVVSVCKYFHVEDRLGLSDSLLAIAILVSSKLEPKTKTTTVAGVILTYVSGTLLVIYRKTDLPLRDQDNPEA